MTDTPTAPFREGLPANYRMRADKHYVDQLDAPPVIPVQRIALGAIEIGDQLAAPSPAPPLVESIKRHGVLEPLLVQKRDRRYRLIAGRKRLVAARAAGLTDVPCLVHRIGDEEARLLATAVRVQNADAADSRPADFAAAEERLASALSAVVSCTSLLSDALPRLTRAVAVDMIRAEAHRAAFAVQALQVLRYGVRHAHRPVALREVVQQIAERVTPEVRLRGVVLETSVQHDAWLVADADQLSSIVAGAIIPMSAALDHGAGARLRVSAAIDADGRILLAAEQDGVIMPDPWLNLLSLHTIDGPAAQDLLPILALRHVAESYGGRVIASRLPHGSRIAVELPQHQA